MYIGIRLPCNCPRSTVHFICIFMLQLCVRMDFCFTTYGSLHPLCTIKPNVTNVLIFLQQCFSWFFLTCIMLSIFSKCFKFSLIFSNSMTLPDISESVNNDLLCSFDISIINKCNKSPKILKVVNIQSWVFTLIFFRSMGNSMNWVKIAWMLQKS